jgi:hypothetical protein
MNLLPLTTPPEALTLLREGWSILTEQLGLDRATQFVILLERGTGDSVQEIAEYWGNRSIEDIHHQVVEWKKMSNQTDQGFKAML